MSEIVLGADEALQTAKDVMLPHVTKLIGADVATFAKECDELQKKIAIALVGASADSSKRAVEHVCATITSHDPRIPILATKPTKRL